MYIWDMKFQETKELIKSTCLEFFKEKPLKHGAALAYYSLLALVPISYLSITYLGAIFGQEVMMNVIDTVLKEQVGLTDGRGILEFIGEVEFGRGSVFIQLIGIVVLLFSCSVIFNSLKGSINDFYNIDSSHIRRKKKIIRGVLSSLISIVFIVGITLLIVVLYFTETMFLSLGNNLLANVESLKWLITGLARHGIPIVSNLIVFSIIFKFLHDGKVDWKTAIRGSLLTTALLYVGQLLIKFYLTNYFFGTGGGVAGTMLIILVWVYYSSQIIFFGAKFIAVYSRMTGSEIKYRH